MRSRVRLASVLVALVASVSLGGCGSGDQTPSSSSASVPAAATPLREAIATMEPKAVWQHFYDLTQIPRPSHHEQAATSYVAEFGRSLGLETVVDDVGNVLIREPASAGMGGHATTVLQSHLDMVALKASDAPVDPATEPLAPVVEAGWVSSPGTTLGADDGIGVATAMALLEDRTAVHGPLEALFTVNEEDGFTGIDNLSTSWLKGRTYINLDNESEGEFVISSAGGVYLDVADSYEVQATPAGSTAFTVGIAGLTGGHSGVDIGKGGGSAHDLIARLLVEAPQALGLRVASIAGGEVANAIPTAASALVVVPSNQTDALRAYVEGFAATVRSEFAETDPGLAVTVTPAELPAKVMAPADQEALVGAVHEAPQGVWAMSEDVPGLVETSGNIGVLSVADGHFTAVVYVRSAQDDERDAEAARFTEVFEGAGCTVTAHDAYSGWPADPDSPILALMSQAYEDTFGKAPITTAIHAGLETSVAGVKYPGMDMISVGPTMEDVHAPDERLEVASVGKVYDLLTATLSRIE